MSVADDAERLTTGLMRTGGGFQPSAAVGGGATLGYSALQENRLRQDQFGHATGVGEGGIEDRNSAALSGVQIHLIGADAKTADGHQFRGIFQDLGSKLRRRTDTDDIGVGGGRDQLVLRQRLGMLRYLGVAVGLKSGKAAGVNPLEQ